MLPPWPFQKDDINDFGPMQIPIQLLQPLALCKQALTLYFINPIHPFPPKPLKTTPNISLCFPQAPQCFASSPPSARPSAASSPAVGGASPAETSRSPRPSNGSDERGQERLAKVGGWAESKVMSFFWGRVF